MSSTLIDRTKIAGVSPSPVKAADSESAIRRFESYYPCQSMRRFRSLQFGKIFAVVAELVDALL